MYVAAAATEGLPSPGRLRLGARGRIPSCLGPAATEARQGVGTRACMLELAASAVQARRRKESEGAGDRVKESDLK